MSRDKFGPVHACPSYRVSVRGEMGSAIYGSPERIPEQVRCYLSSRPNGVVEVYYSEACARCGGAGVVAPKRGRVLFARKPCPRCAGRARVAGAFAEEQVVQVFRCDKSNERPLTCSCDMLH